MKSRMQMCLSGSVLLIALIGAALFAGVSYRSVLRELKHQIVQDNKAIANTIIKSFARYMLSELPRPRQTHLIQNICNEVIIPNKGFVCAVDGEGRVIAMPGLELKSNLNVNEGYFTRLNSLEKYRYQDFADNNIFEGVFYKGDAVTIVAMSLVDNTDIRLFVHQNFPALKNKVKSFVYPQVIIGVMVSVILGVVTYMFAGFIIRKY